MSGNDFNLRLINGWQRGFPLCPRPYQAMAREMKSSERHILQLLAAFLEKGLISRVGAVVRPNTAGASTLAALKAKPDEMERLAALINQEKGVNHNYQREGSEYNLWFVATAPDRAGLDDMLGRISQRTGRQLLDLPMRRAFHIDLGFAIGNGASPIRSQQNGLAQAAPSAPPKASDDDRALLAAMEDGLPLAPQPYALLGRKLGISESRVISQIGSLLRRGIISRLGLVVRHRKMGFVHNAMAVWDIDDQLVAGLGSRLARQPFVTLCYERRRALPDWPFNLYCMIHGRDRSLVRRQAAKLNQIAGEAASDHKLLFSTRCFRQSGPRFSSPAGGREGETPGNNAKIRGNGPAKGGRGTMAGSNRKAETRLSLSMELGHG